MDPLPFKTHAPQIFDRSLKALRKKSKQNNNPIRTHQLHSLLHQLIEERLTFIRRDFDATLIIGDLTLPQFTPKNTIHIQATTPSLEADSEFLPFAPHSFDLIISYFDLHMINDIPGVLAQIHQILKPDGLFLAVFLGGESLWQLRSACQIAELEVRNGASPRVAPMVSLYDSAALLQRAGFALPVADHEKLDWSYDSPLTLLKDLKQLGLSNCLQQQHRGLMGKELFQRIIQTYQKQFANQLTKEITCCFDIVFLSGWRPSPTQQIPLPRGSGKLHLSQVL